MTRMKIWQSGKSIILRHLLQFWLNFTFLIETRRKLYTVMYISILDYVKVTIASDVVYSQRKHIGADR